MNVRCILFCRNYHGKIRRDAIVRRHSDMVEISFFAEESDLYRIMDESCSYAVVICPECDGIRTADLDSAFRNARYLISEERFWEAHEALEDAWHSLSGKRKTVVQAMIWIIAAQVHWQMMHADTALIMHERGIREIRADMRFHYPMTVEDFDSLLNNIRCAGE